MEIWFISKNIDEVIEWLKSTKIGKANSQWMEKRKGNSSNVDEVLESSSRVSPGIISDEMKKKILKGKRKNSNRNGMIGGYSPTINNTNPDYAVEIIDVVQEVADKPAIAVRGRDGATLHREVVNGIHK